MVKTLGYGYKLASESLEQAMYHYGKIDGATHGFHKNKREVAKAIRFDKKEGTIPATSKPELFKVTVEVL